MTTRSLTRCGRAPRDCWSAPGPGISSRLRLRRAIIFRRLWSSPPAAASATYEIVSPAGALHGRSRSRTMDACIARLRSKVCRPAFSADRLRACWSWSPLLNRAVSTSQEVGFSTKSLSECGRTQNGQRVLRQLYCFTLIMLCWKSPAPKNSEIEFVAADVEVPWPRCHTGGQNEQ